MSGTCKPPLEAWNHVPVHLQHITFESIPANAPAVLRTKAIPAFLQLLGRPLSARGISLFGFGHMGKTRTVAAMLNAARGIGIEVGWIYGVRSTREHDTSEAVAYCSRVPLLVMKSIDRKEAARHRAYNQARLEIMRNRKAAGLPTITTSGRNPAEYLEFLRNGSVGDDEDKTRQAFFEIIAELNEPVEVPFDPRISLK